MKIRFLAALFILNMFLTISYSQGINQKWDVVIDDGLKSVSIDTTSIRKNGKQISFWVLEEYKKLQEFSDSQIKIKKIKSQYLINSITVRYSVIGKLFYDELGKLVGESSTPRFSGGGESFYIAIQPNSLEELLLSRVSEQIDTETESRPQFSMAQTQDEQQGVRDTSNLLDINQSATSVAAASTSIAIFDQGEEEISNTTRKVPVRNPRTNNRASAGSVRIYDTATGEYIELTDTSSASEVSRVPVNTQSVDFSSEPDVRPATGVYNVETERNVTNTIYTDGKLYCFQVSSWKTKSIADQEVSRLKNTGHNAYIVEAQPKHKRGTWYRVRVGYFNSLNEAKSAQRSAK
jgi:cell division protein FtsN